MLKEVPFANALAGVTAVLYLICAFLFTLAPDLFRGVAQNWFHGYDLSTIPAAPVTFGGVLVGLVTVTVVTWIFGYLLTWGYNKLAK